MADTQLWHSWTMLLPETPVSTQVLETFPWDQPLVRPTLLTVSPTLCVPVPEILKLPSISSEPLFTPVVFAIAPNVKSVVLGLTNALSL